MRFIKIIPVIFILSINGSVFSQTLLINPAIEKRDDGSVIRHYLELRDENSYSEILFLFLHGSDCNSVLNLPLLNQIKTIYPAADMLYIEKYGVTDSLPYSLGERNVLPEGYLVYDNVRQRSSDANRVLKTVSARYGYRKIIVLGASEGATVAYLLARESGKIDALITIGGGGRYFIDALIQSINAQDTNPEEKLKDIEGARQFARYVTSHDNLDFRMGEHGFYWWKTMFSQDEQETIRGIDTPILILQGGKDTSCSPEKATEMVEHLWKEGKQNIDYYLYSEYDHSLNFSKEDDSCAKVIRDIQVWLQEKLTDTQNF